MMARHTIPAFVVVLALTCAAAGESPWESENKEAYRFPPSMKVVDVKKAFGAVGDGKHDDTAALKKAFDQRAKFVYLPNGTYLVREQVQYTSGPATGPTIVGESRAGVVIKLADDAKGFDDPSSPRAVVRLIRDGRVSADYFKIRIRNLTINTGAHKGATGLMFYANNNGTCRNVRIVGHGAVGLDLSHIHNGPLLVSNVEIRGFDVGIKAGTGPYNSQTLEHILLRGQKDYGIDNDGEALFVRDLQSNNACPAVRSRGNMVLIDSVLMGGWPDNDAIECAGQFFARNVQTYGYAQAIRQYTFRYGKGFVSEVGEPVVGGVVSEWTSHPPVRVGGGGARSLNLPIEEAPYVPLPKDFSAWVCVNDFGADGTDKDDDTAAIQKAFDAAAEKGATVVCFPADGRYNVSGELTVDGSIERIQGAASYLQTGRGKSLRITIKDGGPDVVFFDLLDRPLGGHKIIFDNASSRTLVVRDFRGHLIPTGPGKTFLEDSCSAIHIRNSQARVWVRQLNSENGTSLNNSNAGGTLWVLGLKTERDQTLIATTGGGKTEVLGAWVFQTQTKPVVPMFTVVDSQGSFAGVTQYHWKGAVYSDLVEQTCAGVTQKFTRKDNGGRNSFSLVVAE